jgi:anti-anti-sigma factor
LASDELVHWTRSGGYAVAHVAGELDLATAEPTFAAIAESRPVGSALVIDLSAVEFMDSTALGQLVGFRPNEEIRVVAPDGTGPRRVLEITKLTSRFPTFETVAAAVAIPYPNPN